MSEHDNTERIAYITLGVMMGAAIGAVAGFLSAPRSGADTRNMLRSRALDAKGRAHDQLSMGREKMAEKLSKTLDKSKDVADNATASVKDAADKTKSRAKNAADQAKAEVGSRSSATAS